MDSSRSSSQSLQNRRHSLRNQRRVKVGQSVWRFFALLAMTGGLFWLVSLPQWLIKDVSQIEISRNQFIPDEIVYRWLSLTYPLSFWQVPIAEIERKLMEQAPIESVRIARHLFPPKLQIFLQERKPVALALFRGKMGFLDEGGTFIPQTLYPQGKKALPQSPLKVLGAEELNPQLWRSLLPLIRQSSVKIEALDWRDPSNLMLDTEIGRVQLGGNPDTLMQQFHLVSQLRSLTAQVPRNRVVAIDLSNPTNPLLKLKPLPKPPQLHSSPRN